MDKLPCLLFIGLGRIGLPQALVFANAGFTVYGFDNNTDVISDIQGSRVLFREPNMQEYLKRNLGIKFFLIKDDKEFFNKLSEVDALFFTIGTPAIDSEQVLTLSQLDLTHYYRTIDKVFSHSHLFKKALSIIFRSTFPIGTTDKIKAYIESCYDIQEGEDFYIAYVPERIVEGNAIYEEESLYKIIGTYSNKSYDSVSNLFTRLAGKTIRVSNPKAAEFCKLTDNCFRSTLFSYSNEIAMLATKLGINAREIIQTVNHHYPRNNIPFPGYVSGYCLSKDPYFLEIDFLKDNSDRDFHSVWYYGAKTNNYLATYAAHKILTHLKDPPNSCVSIIGLSFKKDTDDFRMSHAFEIMRLLINYRVRSFKVYDPFLKSNKYTEIPDNLIPFVSSSTNLLSDTIFSDVDAILIANDHKPLYETQKDKVLHFINLTKKPCYLFDAYNVWGFSSYLKHLEYESF